MEQPHDKRIESRMRSAFRRQGLRLYKERDDTLNGSLGCPYGIADERNLMIADGLTLEQVADYLRAAK